MTHRAGARACLADVRLKAVALIPSVEISATRPEPAVFYY